MVDPVTHISLCAGIGGLDIGLRRVFPGLRTVAYVEREISACEILGAQMEKGNLDMAPIWTDVKTFPADQFCGMVDIVSGGYPCQPFSVAGKRGGTDDRRHLWPYIARIVDAIRPRICIFENVRGHVRLGLSEVLGELGRIGYRVRAGIFSAAEVGAPHRRERVFIVAHAASKRDKRDICHAERGQGSALSRQPIEPGERPLADCLGEGLQRHAGDADRCDEPGRIAQRQDGSVGACGVLENAVSERWGRGDIRHATCKGKRDETETEIEGSRFGPWPAKPGEAQHEWEEPRTIDRKLNPAWVAQLMGLPSDWVDVEGLTREMKLRALGNGVVPQQAELAIRTLLQ